MKRFLVWTALILGPLFLVEVGLRVFTSANSEWNVRIGAHKRFDPITQFRLKSHYDYGHGIVSNEYGFLAPERLSHEKPPDRLRLLFLGDSASHQPVHANFPKQVGEILAERGIAVETVNTAVPGFATHNALALLESEVSGFEADYFFVYLGHNDLGQFGPEGLPYKKKSAGYQISRTQEVLASFYLPRVLYALTRFLRRYSPTVDEPLSPEDIALYQAYYPQHYEDNLREILSIAKAHYPRVYVLNLATLANDDPDEDDLRLAHFPTGMDKNMRKLHRLVLQYNEVIARVAREEGVPMIDLYSVFDAPKPRREFTDSAHMNPAGTRRMGRLVADVVEANERRESE